MNVMIRKAWQPLLILVLGVVIAIAVARSGPEAPKRPHMNRARLVEVLTLEQSDTQVTVEVTGMARAAQEVELKPLVSGEIVSLGQAMVPGGFARAGELIARIDPRDYEFVVRQRESAVASAQQALELEKAQQQIARREYEMLGDVVEPATSDLVLRQPQWKAVQGALDAALASLAQAQLNLERTSIRAPFNCIVIEKHADRGAFMSTNTPIATVVGTDHFWVELSVPMEKLHWIEMPGGKGGPGSLVQIRQPTVWGSDAQRDGHVIQLMGNLETEGRMARVLVEVADPYCLRPEHHDLPRLLAGAYVEASIQGLTVEDAIRIPRRYVHNGSTIWLRDAEGGLEIRPVQPVYSGRDEILVTEDLRGGEQLVTTEIAAPVAGMPLRTSADEPGTESETSKAKTPSEAKRPSKGAGEERTR